MLIFRHTQLVLDFDNQFFAALVYVDQRILAQFADCLRVIGHERVGEFVPAEIQQHPVHHVGQFLVRDGSAGRARDLYDELPDAGHVQGAQAPVVIVGGMGPVGGPVPFAPIPETVAAGHLAAAVVV